MVGRLPLDAGLVARTPSEVLRLLAELLDRIEKLEAESQTQAAGTQERPQAGRAAGASATRPAAAPKRRPPAGRCWPTSRGCGPSSATPASSRPTTSPSGPYDTGC